MKFLLTCTFILFTSLFISCKEDSKIDSPASKESVEYRYYNLENRGWKSRKQTFEFNHIKYTAVDVPIQYYLLKQLGNDDLVEVDSVFNTLRTERIIEFVFEHNQGVDLLTEKYTGLDTESSIKYMSFAIDKDFYAITSKKDTIPCNNVLYERHFKVTPYTKILLFFSGINPEEVVQIIYEDNLFKNGKMTFFMNEPYEEILL